MHVLLLFTDVVVAIMSVAKTKKHIKREISVLFWNCQLIPLGATQVIPQPACRRLGLGDSRPMQFTRDALALCCVVEKNSCGQKNMTEIGGREFGAQQLQTRCVKLLAISRRPRPHTALGSSGLGQQRNIGLARIKSWGELH